MPKLSVVMSVYNSEAGLDKTIDSILGQTFSDFEFIIVDDGSFDNTPAILSGYKEKDSRIKIITQENHGLTYSLNKAISISSGKYIARQDPEDISKKDRFESQILYLEDNPDIAVVGSNYHIIDEKENIIETTNIPLTNEEISKNLIEQNCFGHGTVMMRRESFIKIGGYDENFPYAQDYDLWLRMSEKFKLANLKKPLYLWKRSIYGTSYKKRIEQEEYARIARQNALIRRNQNKEKRKNPFVSVILPTYNRPKMFEDALRSILGQTFQDFEIIVVNDAGEDVQPVIEKYDDERITYIKHSENKGLAAARNTGIKNASGIYLNYLDDDDVFYHNHLFLLIDTAKKNNSDVVYSLSYRAIQSPIQKGDYKIFLKEMPYANEFDRDRILIENLIPINSVMHKKACVEKAGFFDETLPVFEDWDFQIRLSRNYDFHCVPHFTSETRLRLDNSNMTFSKWQEFVETKKTIYKKYEKYVNDHPSLILLQKKSLADLNQMAESSMSLTEYLLIVREDKVFHLEQQVKELEKVIWKIKNSIFYKLYSFINDKIKKLRV
ncbi:MAG: glycosyltransferase [Candidatus Schekmanbacteria bacterium]|nr:MAG: glycosyltransferase [Candidatus Schekmanbacteria bacterium]